MTEDSYSALTGSDRKPETIQSREVHGRFYAIQFNPKLPGFDAYEFLEDGRVIETRLRLDEARELLAARPERVQ